MTAPQGGLTDNLAAWAIPAAGGVVALGTAALWAGAGLASVLTGHGWPPVTLSLQLPVTLARDGGTEAVWPGVPTGLLLALTGVLAALVLLPALYLMVRWLGRRPSGITRSLAAPTDVRTFLPGPAATKARQLRTDLPDKPTAADSGITLGRLQPGGAQLIASWEDVCLAVMAPRAGKTTALAVPAALAAPGPVLLTSNKTDAWAATAQLRQQDTGQPVWTFDPQQITRGRQSWTWDPPAELTGVQDAERLAGHFVLTVDDDRARDIWGPAATELLAALFLAAAVDSQTLVTAYGWLQSEVNPTAGSLPDSAGYPALAASLRGTMKAPAETRGSVYFTARTATRCLRDPGITAWTSPTTGLATFDPAAFVTSRQTLYLLSKDRGGSAAPLVAALTDRVLRCAVRAAENTGGRLDRPLLAVLDEAANICRIGDLPQLYSHLGSRGVVPITILQSYAQGAGVWGDKGMAALWSAATVKLLAAGLDDPRFAQDVSRLVGEHDVQQESWSSGTGRATRTRSTRRERILTAAQVRALPKGTALLLATGAKPALLQLLPFYNGTRADEIATATARAVAGIADHPSPAAPARSRA